MDYEDPVTSEDEAAEEEEEGLTEEQRGQLGGRLRGLIGGSEALPDLPDELLGESLLNTDTLDMDLLFPGQQSGGGKKRRRKGASGSKKRKKKKKPPAQWYENDMCYALTWVTAHLEPFLERCCGVSYSARRVWSPASMAWDQNPRLSRLTPFPMWSTFPRSRLGPFCAIPPPSIASYPTVLEIRDAPSSTDRSRAGSQTSSSTCSRPPPSTTPPGSKSPRSSST